MQVTTTTAAGTTTTPGNASTTASTTSSSASSSATIDYNSFLKLLVAELQNQDPTSPSDPMQYMSQLASFSAVGQTVQTNTKLDTMLTNQALAQADSAIGRTVTSADGTTTGVVSSATIGTGGAITATLANGSTLALGTGTVVS